MNRYLTLTIEEAPPGMPEWKGRQVYLDEDVVKRLITEEVQAQTVWPQGELPLAEVVRRQYGP